MKVLQLFIFTLFLFPGQSLSQKMPGYKFDQFKDSPVYELAKAAKNNNGKKIEKLIKNKKADLEYKSKFGYTVLMVSVFNLNYNAVEALLKNGADPNARDKIGRTILMIQSDGITTDYCDTKMTELLIKYGADVNAFSNYNKKRDPQNPEAEWGLYRATPLMEASEGSCIEKLKVLIAHGADPNKCIGDVANCPITRALIQNRMDVVKYLIMVVKIKIPPYCQITLDKDTVTLLGMLRGSIYRLGSTNHQLKMEVVKYLKDHHNLDYFKEPIPDYELQDIKREFPDSWEEYLKKY